MADSQNAEAPVSPVQNPGSNARDALLVLSETVLQFSQLRDWATIHRDQPGSRGKVRRSVLEMHRRLSESGICSHPAARPFAVSLQQLMGLSANADIGEALKAVDCPPVPLSPPTTAETQNAAAATPPGPAPTAVEEPAPPTSAGWELYARPSDVADWQTVLMLSGCTWKCTGGGQRPVQLSRELARLGKTIVYCGVHSGQKNGWIPGGLTCNMEGLRERIMPWLRQIRGTVMMCLPLPDVIDVADDLVGCGWRVIYDCIDDWEAFARTGYWADWREAWEARAVGIADVVTASARHLCQKVERWRPRKVVYLPNAGGFAYAGRTGKPPSDLVRGEHGTVIYVGAVDGTWLDWGLVADARAALESKGVTVNIIGGTTWQAAAAGHCLGEKPVDEIGPYLAWSDAAIIPFGDAIISSSVDPIKYYEYRAAGLRVVATDVLTELTGRQGVHLAAGDAGRFANAVLEAVQLGRLPATSGERENNVWAARALSLLPLLSPTAPMTGPAPAGVVRQTNESDCVLRASWDMTTRCNLQCPYCNTEPARRNRVAQPVSPRTVLWAWNRLSEAVGGPVYLSVDFGDPMADGADVAIVAELARQHRIDIVTNLKFDRRRLEALAEVKSNVAFACSYHPHAWRGPGQFLDKYSEMAEAGFRMGVVAVVAWPPYVPRVSDWVHRLRVAGVSAYVLPFQGMHGGRLYPQAYSIEERRLLASNDLTYDEGQGLEHLGLRDERPTGRLCETGWKYIYVHNDGTIARCPYDTRPLGNLFAGEWALVAEATPCRAELCVCPDLWRYVVQEPHANP